MDSLSHEEFNALFSTFDNEALHLEMRDSYGTEAELPHMRKWLAGEPDDAGWLQPWFETVHRGTSQGRVFKRVRIVSEPVSDYQRWVLKDTHRYVGAGEDIRWVPRRRASLLASPGNDFWLFDDRLVVFILFAGNGLVVDNLATTATPADATPVGSCKGVAAVAVTEPTVVKCVLSGR